MMFDSYAMRSQAEKYRKGLEKRVAALESALERKAESS